MLELPDELRGQRTFSLYSVYAFLISSGL